MTSGGVVEDPSGIPVATTVDEQWMPSITTGSSQLMVVWQDSRASGLYAIFGSRIQGGTVLDPNGFVITPGQETYNPAVAFGGDRYLVSWQDYRNDWHSEEDTDIYSARVTSDGEVLDPDGFLTSRGLTTQFDVAVATDGEDYLVAWTDDRPTAGEYDIYAARVSGSGEILDGGGFPVATVWGDQFEPAVAWSGSEYLVVWRDERYWWDHNVYGARITPDGTVLDPEPIEVATGERHEGAGVSVASSGERFLVTWSDSANKVRATRVDPTGRCSIPTDSSSPWRRRASRTARRLRGARRRTWWSGGKPRARRSPARA